MAQFEENKYYWAWDIDPVSAGTQTRIWYIVQYSEIDSLGDAVFYLPGNDVEIPGREFGGILPDRIKTPDENILLEQSALLESNTDGKGMGDGKTSTGNVLSKP